MYCYTSTVLHIGNEAATFMQLVNEVHTRTPIMFSSHVMRSFPAGFLPNLYSPPQQLASSPPFSREAKLAHRSLVDQEYRRLSGTCMCLLSRALIRSTCTTKQVFLRAYLLTRTFSYTLLTGSGYCLIVCTRNSMYSNIVLYSLPYCTSYEYNSAVRYELTST